jgi:hypothetical protein
MSCKKMEPGGFNTQPDSAQSTDGIDKECALSAREPALHRVGAVGLRARTERVSLDHVKKQAEGFIERSVV